MSETEIKPNSDRSKMEKPKAEKVVSGTVTKAKEPLGKRIKNNVFNAENLESVGNNIFDNMIVPAIQDLVTEIFQTGVDIFMETVKSCVYGESKRPSNSYHSTNKKNYSKISRSGKVTTENREYHKARKGFENALLETRLDADRVKDQMMEYVIQYDFVSIADFYGFVDIDPQYTDEHWGWYPGDIENLAVRRVRGGWMLDLPDPKPLD